MPWWPTRGSWAPRLLYSTYISGRLRQHNPARKQAFRLVLRRNRPMFPPAIWNVHDATVNGDARTSNMWSSGVKRKKLLSVLLSSKMPLVTHQLSVLSRDMFSSKCVYRTYAETSLLARRPLPSSCVERIEHQTQSPTLLLKRQLTLWAFTILNRKYSMFVCSSLYRYDLIYFICYLLYDL